jgi:hypothetical protein
MGLGAHEEKGALPVQRNIGQTSDAQEPQQPRRPASGYGCGLHQVEFGIAKEAQGFVVGRGLSPLAVEGGLK